MTDSTTPGPVERPRAPAWRLLVTLGVAGAVAGTMIVLTWSWAEPRIEAHRAEVLREAIEVVLGSPARVDTLYVVDGALRPEPPSGSIGTVERVWRGYDASGSPVGYAVVGGEPGFQDIIRLIFGYDPATGTVLGMRVLENKETPGLGDAIVKDEEFVAGFDSVAAPLEGVKAGAGGDDPHEVDMITGATISSRTIIDIINHRLEALGPMIEAHAGGSAP